MPRSINLVDNISAQFTGLQVHAGDSDSENNGDDGDDERVTDNELTDATVVNTGNASLEDDPDFIPVNIMDHMVQLEATECAECNICQSRLHLSQSMIIALNQMHVAGIKHRDSRGAAKCMCNYFNNACRKCIKVELAEWSEDDVLRHLEFHVKHPHHEAVKNVRTLDAIITALATGNLMYKHRTSGKLKIDANNANLLIKLMNCQKQQSDASFTSIKKSGANIFGKTKRKKNDVMK